MDSAAQQLAPLLARLVNYERTRPDERLWDLSSMQRVLSDSGLPAPVRPAIQVGGSKGKGTTCAFLEALTRGAGAIPGLYSSPHLVTLLERIRCDGRDIAVGDLEQILERVLAIVGMERPLTFFEAMTTAAAVAFAERRVDLAIYEVGLGGRHDATTALPVDAGIITNIELEHTDVLGDTVAAIAAEKAAILRPGGVGFTAATGEALEVIREHAAQRDARLHVFGEDFWCTEPVFEGRDARFRMRLPDGLDVDVTLPGASVFEIPALALAAAAFRHVLPNLPLPLDPAPRPLVPCRFEVLEDVDGEVIVLDGAHTEGSMVAVFREMHRRWPGRRVPILFGMAAGKRWRESLSVLLPIADSVVVTGLADTSSEDPAAIASWLAGPRVASEVAADVEAGLLALRRGPGPRLVVGSFYLAGCVRRLVTDRTSDQE